MNLSPRAVRRWLWRWKGSALLLCLAVTLYGSRYYVLRSAADFLDVTQPLTSPVDYVMVLGGGHDTRPFVAAALVKKGLARGVLVPSVAEDPDDDASASETEMIQRVLEARGAPPQAICRLPGACTSTADEAASLKTFLDAAAPCTVAVVTDASHSRRARWIFARVLGEHEGQVRFVAAPSNGFDKSAWWKTESGSVCYLSECLKFAYYWLKY